MDPVIICQPGGQRGSAYQHGFGTEIFQALVEREGAHRAIGFVGVDHRETGSDEHQAADISQVGGGAQVIAGLEGCANCRHTPRVSRDQQFFDGVAQRHFSFTKDGFSH